MVRLFVIGVKSEDFFRIFSSLPLVVRIIFLSLCFAICPRISLAQNIQSVAVASSETRLGAGTEFSVRLKSDSDTYACAFEIDFGDGSSPKAYRAFQESDGLIRGVHTYLAVGEYVIRVKGAVSFLDRGFSIQSLLPVLACSGDATTKVSILPAKVGSACIPLPDETQTVECPLGGIGKINQRRSFSCPGPVPGPWITVSDTCRSKEDVVARASEGRGRENGGDLINAGWWAFIGKAGVVDEFEALRLTSEGVRLSKLSNAEHIASIGLNNLSVFHQCALDPRVRDYELGRKIAKREIGKNNFTSENYIWGVFLRKENPDWEEFVSFLREHRRNHPVTNFIARGNGRPPANYEAALKVLMREGRLGDHHAAKWVGYAYECGPDPINVGEAMRWMTISFEAAKRAGVSDRELRSIEERLSRLKLHLESRN